MKFRQVVLLVICIQQPVDSGQRHLSPSRQSSDSVPMNELSPGFSQCVLNLLEDVVHHLFGQGKSLDDEVDRLSADVGHEIRELREESSGRLKVLGHLVVGHGFHQLAHMVEQLFLQLRRVVSDQTFGFVGGHSVTGADFGQNQMFRFLQFSLAFATQLIQFLQKKTNCQL